MTTLAYPAQAYQATEAATADPRHLVVLLFDAMVRFLHRAREATVQGDRYEQCQGVLRAQKILSALLAALNPGVEPAFVDGLFALYNWLHGKLTEAGMSDDPALLDEILAIVTQLRDAWRQAEVNCRQSEA
jgi:flagellar secretion chaperone FliS